MAAKMKARAVDYSKMSTSNIVNTVRAAYANGESASGINFADRIPECNLSTLQQIGEIFDSDSDLANNFLKEIMNRIGLVDMNYRRYENNLKLMKEGRLEFGETVEEIAFGLVKAKCDYNEVDGVTDVFQLTLPEVASALHKVNFQQKYPLSITRATLRKAFTSESSLGSFIDGVMTTLYNSYEVDEQLAYKNLLLECLLQGNMKAIEIQPITDESTGKAFVKMIKSTATKMRFMNTNYSKYGLPQFTPERDLIVIMDADTDAAISVDVLAAAFNMSQVQFIESGIKVVIDYFPVEGVHAILADKRMFQIYDNDFALESIYNPSNRVWNYFLHVWEVISASPFMQGVALVDSTAGSVTAVTLTPNTATVAKGGTQVFTANVTATGVATQKVNWAITGATSTNTNIKDTSNDGTDTISSLLTVGVDETATTITVTATSVFDGSVSGTATVTVSA